MKFTVITAVLASSVTTTAESVKNLAGKSLRDVVADLPRSRRSQIHRDLTTVSTNDKDGIRAVLKERRGASKMRNNGMIRRLQDKLIKRSKLRNQRQAQEDGDVSDGGMDIGFFSRNLQNDTESEPEPEEMTIMEVMALQCGSNDYYAGPGYNCSCSNVDVDAYTGTTLCTYDENFQVKDNFCGGSSQINFVETFSVDMTAAGKVTERCYFVNLPTEPFSYCYGLTYNNEEGGPKFTDCSFEVDGTQCNSCEFEYYTTAENTTGTCRNFDCTNVDDDDITTGEMCEEYSMTGLKLEPYLTTDQFPCAGGCSLCPEEGEMMMNPDANVALITGEIYSCSLLNQAAGTGLLGEFAGDLCNTLKPAVNETCGCMIPETPEPTSAPNSEEAPVETLAGSPAGSPVNIGDGVTDQAVDEPVESAAPCSGIDRIAIAAAVASIFLWMV